MKASMSRLKIMTIVGTRPEIIKLSRVICELEKFMDHILVHTGQNYDDDLNEIFFRDLHLSKPRYFLACAGSNAAETIGNVIIEADKVIKKEQPDAVLIYGDTNSCLAALSAKRQKVPVFHMEAGNRCFDQRVPEEINRKMLDHISDLNLTISEHARRYLLAEGLPPERTFKVGSSMKEVFHFYMPGILASTILEKLSLEIGNYFIVSIHREENVDTDENLMKILNTLNLIAETYKKTVIVSTHPRTRLRIEALNGKTKQITMHALVQFLKPFGFLDYAHLQLNAFCVLSDSGSITEDANILNFPAVTLRETHERPEGMDVGTLIMAGLTSERVIQAIEIATRQCEKGQRRCAIAPDYDVDDLSKKVVKIIVSYIDYINSKVWHKNRDGEIRMNAYDYAAN